MIGRLETKIKKIPRQIERFWPVGAVVMTSRLSKISILLGNRSVDRYDWCAHVGTTLTRDAWDQIKLSPIDRPLPPLRNPDTLNPEQRVFYDTLVNHYEEELGGLTPPQLLVNCDGKAGTGRTHTILQTCRYLDLLADEQSLPSLVLRAAPTGVAAFNFFGRTLHSSFKLPVKGSTWELSLGDLTGLQARFRHLKYLIIDEKSMVDLKTLGIIDERLRDVFPDKNMEPFGGLNVVVTGDNWQLQPVGWHPLFKVSAANLEPIAIKGQTAYRALNKTIRFTQVMRQSGEAPEMVQFRDALEELRNDNLSIENWEFLSSRAQINLSPAEIASFEQALRLYSTNAEVDLFNFNKLRDSGMPVKKFEAIHRGLGAKTANKDQADNLLAEVYYSLGCRVMLTANAWTENGLVNGSLGTIRDIVWEEGKDPSKDLPLAIMVEFDGYKGPFFGDTRTVPVFHTTTRFRHNNHDCERSQFPLVVAYANKSQGMTLKKAVLNIEKKDFRPGLSYVGTSLHRGLQAKKD